MTKQKQHSLDKFLTTKESDKQSSDSISNPLTGFNQLIDYLYISNPQSKKHRTDGRLYQKSGNKFQTLLTDLLRSDTIALQQLYPFNQIPNLPIEFNKKILLPDQILRLFNEKKDYFQFDGYIESTDSSTPSIILEMKLGPTSLTSKEFKYLYYFPDTILVYIFYYPAKVDYHQKLYASLTQKWNLVKDRYPATFQPDLQRRVRFFGHTELGSKITSHELLFAVNHELLYQLLSVASIVAEHPQKYLIGKDFQKLFNLHHDRVDFLLDILVEKHILTKQVTTIKDSLNKINPSAALFSLHPVLQVADLTTFLTTMQSTYKLKLLIPSDYQIPDREIVASGLSDNDIKILAYLQVFPAQFVCPPDVRENTQIANTEVLNRLTKLSKEGYLIERPSWFIDKYSTSDKYYNGNAYKIESKFINNKDLSDEIIKRSVISYKFNDPSRISLDYPLTLNEIQVLLLLFRTEDILTISDISEFFNMSSATVENLVRRLADPLFITERMKSKAPEFLKIDYGWTLSKLTEKSKLAKSPLITLNPICKSDNKFIDFINNISIQVKINYHDFSKILVPVEYPLGIQEARLVCFLLDNKALSNEKGIKPASIYKTLILTSNPASNKSTVVRILKILTSKELLSKRFGSEFLPILKKTYDSRYFISKKYSKDDKFRNYIEVIKREFY